MAIVLIDSYSESNASIERFTGDFGGAATGEAQSFVPGTSRTLAQATFYVRNINSSGNAFAKLYSSSGGAPGSLLATSDPVDVSAWGSTSTLRDFTFSGGNQYAMVSGTTYFIAYEHVDGTLETGIFADNSSPSHSGSGFELFSGVWTARAYDVCFYVYGNEASSASPSQSISPSVSPSVSPSTSISPSVSPSPSPGFTDYTRGDYVTLPTDDTDLETLYSAGDYTNVSAQDSVYVSQTATNQFAVHQFKNYVSTNNCRVTWVGKTSLAPSTASVFLQIYNRTTLTWVIIDSDGTSAVNTNFTLTAIIPDLTDYKNAQNLISCRVHQSFTIGGNMIGLLSPLTY